MVVSFVSQEVFGMAASCQYRVGTIVNVTTVLFSWNLGLKKPNSLLLAVCTSLYEINAKIEIRNPQFRFQKIQCQQYMTFYLQWLSLLVIYASSSNCHISSANMICTLKNIVRDKATKRIQLAEVILRSFCQTSLNLRWVKIFGMLSQLVSQLMFISS